MKYDYLVGEIVRNLVPKSGVNIINAVSDTLSIKKVNISDILGKLNSGELFYGDIVEVDGLLSSFAFVSTRKSDSPNVIKYTKDDNGHGFSSIVRPFSLSRFMPQEGVSMRFLYTKSSTSPFYVKGINETDSIKIEISDENKFVPVLINDSSFLDVNLGYYTLLGRIKEFPSENRLITSLHYDPKLSALKSYYFDNSFPIYSNFYLELVKYELSDFDYKNRKVNFDEKANVMFEIVVELMVDGSQDYLSRRISGLLTEFRPTIDGRKLKIKSIKQKEYKGIHYLIDSPVLIELNENELFLSINYHMDEPFEFRKSYEELKRIFQLVSEEFYGNIDISFISDEVKLPDFMQIYDNVERNIAVKV